MADMSPHPVAVVVGVGAGLGAALTRRFAAGYRVAMLARDLGPQGIHVAHINVDGGIDMPFIRQRFPEAKDEDLLKPSAIAETYWHLAHQDPSAWTQELDVRPFKEKF